MKYLATRLINWGYSNTKHPQGGGKNLKSLVTTALNLAEPLIQMPPHGAVDLKYWIRKCQLFCGQNKHPRHKLVVITHRQKVTSGTQFTFIASEVFKFGFWHISLG